MSIRLKLAIMFLAIALIPTLFVGAISFTDYKKSLEAARILDLQNIAAFKADKIETYFAGLKANIRLAQTSFPIKENFLVLNRLANEPNNPEFLAAEKKLDVRTRQMQANFGLSDIMLVNPQGRVVYSSNPEHHAKHFLNVLSDPGQKAFEEGKSKIYFTNPNSAVRPQDSGFLLIGRA
jgi:hypothetical protein